MSTKTPTFGHIGKLIVATLAAAFAAGCGGAAKTREPLEVKLDSRGPYVILASRKAEASYTAALAAAGKLHPDAERLSFDPGDLETLKAELQKRQPRYALVFVEPDELDVNFAWQWLAMTTQLDDDPFVDVRTGFITGDSPESAEAFIKRIAAVVHGDVKLPGKLIDNLGPNTQAKKEDFYQTPGNFFLTAFGQRMGMETISHGNDGFSEARLKSMDGAGVIHFGGHGNPERVDDGVQAAQARRLALSPCVAFNGACYTGVTSRWFEQWTAAGTVAERTVAPKESFCLNLLANQAVAYLAALHPDHGIPVYQEMEFMAYSGASLGDVMKHTHDGVVLGAGGKLPALDPFANGSPPPQWTPSDVMLNGTAARVLFGDPALIVGSAFAKPPFEQSIAAKGDTLTITAKVSNDELKSTFTDTYHADLASDPNLFNDRALITVELPAGWQNVGTVKVDSVQAGGKSLKNRLVGFGVEQDAEANWLHVQVDVPTEGYMQSQLRSAKGTVTIKVSR